LGFHSLDFFSFFFPLRPLSPTSPLFRLQAPTQYSSWFWFRESLSTHGVVAVMQDVVFSVPPLDTLCFFFLSECFPPARCQHFVIFFLFSFGVFHRLVDTIGHCFTQSFPSPDYPFDFSFFFFLSIIPFSLGRLKPLIQSPVSTRHPPRNVL